MTTHENSRSHLGGAESRLNSQSLVKKWHVADPKMIFAKNQEVEFFALKCKATPVPAKSEEACVNFRIRLQRLPQQKESWYEYHRWSTIYVGCFSQLSIPRFGSCFTKKTRFRHSKNGKSNFRGTKQKISLRGVPRHPKGHTPVRYGLFPTNYAMVMPDSSSFQLEVMQPRTW
jgi:hypothetical protein